MAFTMTPAGVINTHYTTRILLRDWLNEEIRKVTKLYNAGAAGNVQAAWRAFEAATNAGLMKVTQSQEIVISAQSTTITEDGQHWAGVEHVLILGFTREHPLNAEKTIEASFGIPAPVDAIINTSNNNKPSIIQGIDFATAADVNESTGALVDFLQNALTYEAINGTIYNGGWTYSEAKSGLLSNPRLIDGVKNT